MSRFNTAEGEPHLSKKEKLDKFKELCQSGPTVVIDCEFEHLMLEQEIKPMT